MRWVRLLGARSLQRVGAQLMRRLGIVRLARQGGELAQGQRYDAVVALGVVIRGGTPHFDYVCQAATMGLTDVSTATGVPIGFGVLTTDDEQQGLDRAGLEGSSEDKGYDAAVAAVDAALTVRGLGH